jgi:hypothetical protein
VLCLHDHDIERSRFEAIFLSQRITAALLSDPTIAEYDLELDPPSDSGACPTFDSVCFAGILAPAHGNSFELTWSNFEFVRFLAWGFEDREIYQSLLDFGRELNCSNAAERLSLAASFQFSTSIEIDCLALHCHELNQTILKSMSYEALREVLTSDKLSLFSEDSLLDALLELGDEYASLIAHDSAEYLSVAGINRLLDSILLSVIGGELWL